MDSRLSRWCDGLIEAGWLAAVVLTPLFFNIHSSRVFEPDKLTLLRSIATLMAAAWLIKFIDLQGWRSLSWLKWRSENSIWRMPFVLPVVLLVIVYLVSTVFSVTRSVSWAGSYQRLQGTYTTLAYIVVFALMLATLRSREQITRLITTIIVTSIPVSLYAMLQHFGLDPLPWGGDTQQRVAGHMGNSIFVAAYLIMVVPLTLARIIDAFTNILQDEELSVADVVRSSIYIFAVAIQLIAIYWTRSRGPFMGLAVSMYAFVLILLVTLRNADTGERRLSAGDVVRAILITLLGTAVPFLLAVTVLQSSASSFASFGFFIGAVGLLVVVILVLALARRGWRWLWLSWILLAVIMAGFLGLFNFSDQLAERYEDRPLVGDAVATLGSWRSLPEIGRFGQLLQSERGSGRVRVLIWDGVLELIATHEPLETPDGREDPFNFLRPVVGYGPESMYVAYNRFYQPELATIEARNASPDRSHNETFDAVVITGAAGLLVWQFLYLSVFYYGFSWLGVVRSKRDRNILIGLWILGAVLGGAVITAVLGMPFIGVALPFGAIGGLVVYLIYYAVTAKIGENGESQNPFGVDRLLMIALVAAVLAHYVEIHFGIAIAASRTHFFVYIALMFLLGYLLPRAQTLENLEEEPVKSRKKRRARVPVVKANGWIAPILSSAFILSLIIGTLSYNYMTFSLPGGTTIETLDDVPSTGEIVHQSFFVNAGNNFTESPFIFLLLLLTWILGLLLFLSEFAKGGQLTLSTNSSKLRPGRLRAAGLVFVAMLVLSVAARFLLPRPPDAGLTRLIGEIASLLWAALCLWAAVQLFRERASARLTAGSIAFVGLALTVPILIAGQALVAFILLLASVAVLYLLWDSAWSDFLLPAGLMSFLSAAVGFSFAYFHAYLVRAGILPPPGLTESTSPLIRRVLEADQTISLLTTYYIFLFGLLLLIALVLAWPRSRGLRDWGSTSGFLATFILVPLAFVVIGTTNLQVIQADIAYKRADPWDKQASRTTDPALWDNAIAIYEHAIDLAPVEDFYYLWLGRAYLERSGITEDESEKEALLMTAEERLLDAQKINPLNTDHTANLARLNTRWAELASGDERQLRVTRAADFYDAAMSLSPKNSIIINEYARLAYLLQDDCAKSLELYDRSIETDPFYPASYVEQSEVLLACADSLTDTEQQDYYHRAADRLSRSLELEPGDPRRWLKLAEIHIRLGQVDEALAAYEESSALAVESLPQWQLDYTMAQWFLEEQNFDQARQFAQSALELAPEDVQDQVQLLLSNIEGTQ